MDFSAFSSCKGLFFFTNWRLVTVAATGVLQFTTAFVSLVSPTNTRIPDCILVGAKLDGGFTGSRLSKYGSSLGRARSNTSSISLFDRFFAALFRKTESNSFLISEISFFFRLISILLVSTKLLRFF